MKIELQDLEVAHLIRLLKLAANQFSNNGCNDFELENNNANWDIKKAIDKECRIEDDDEQPDTDYFHTTDWLFMNYLARSIEEQYKNSPCTDSKDRHHWWLADKLDGVQFIVCKHCGLNTFELNRDK